ncbi:MAG: DUF6316 family protein [Gammaproteobacteria bacterium]|nr:DUF6316 family protein [Gammaproteobacteria bacterium]
MQPNATAIANRLEGRLFSAEGRLYFVVAVDTRSGFARVSFRADGKQQIAQLPISEVGMRLTSGSNLRPDGLSSAEKANRLIQKSDGWFFSTREGMKGPYPSETDADRALSTHVLSTQSDSAP